MCCYFSICTGYYLTSSWHNMLEIMTMLTARTKRIKRVKQSHIIVFNCRRDRTSNCHVHFVLREFTNINSEKNSGEKKLPTENIYKMNGQQSYCVLHSSCWLTRRRITKKSERNAKNAQCKNSRGSALRNHNSFLRNNKKEHTHT